MKDKKIKVVLIIALITLVGVIVFSFFSNGSINKKLDDKQVILPQEGSEKIESDIINTPGEFEEKELENELYSAEELEKTKQIAVEFANAIYNVDSSNPLIYPTEATQYTIQSLKDRILGIANTETPDVYKRIVTSVEVVGSNIDEESKALVWNLVLQSNIINEEEIQTGTERGNIKVVFVKDGEELKVGEYSIERTPNNFN